MLDIAHIHHHHRVFDNDKQEGPSALFVRQQPHAVIELVEVAPPPPRRIGSLIHSSSYFSSSAGSDTTDNEADEDDSEHEQEDEEAEKEAEDEEMECSSYCSSDVWEKETPSCAVPRNESYQRSMKRILQWRERAMPGDSSTAPTTSKRKFDSSMLGIEYRTSKRSRSSSSSSAASSVASSASSQHSRFLPLPSSAYAPLDGALSQRRYSTTSSITSAELDMHPCPACDSFFPTLMSLRAHGKATGSEACCVAVEYAFEK